MNTDSGQLVEGKREIKRKGGWKKTTYYVDIEICKDKVRNNFLLSAYLVIRMELGVVVFDRVDTARQGCVRGGRDVGIKKRIFHSHSLQQRKDEVRTIQWDAGGNDAKRTIKGVL